MVPDVPVRLIVPGVFHSLMPGAANQTVVVSRPGPRAGVHIEQCRPRKNPHVASILVVAGDGGLGWVSGRTGGDGGAQVVIRLPSS